MITDEKYMRLAIALARKGAGWVNPNPMVGAVLVKKGKIIGKGYHRFFGGPHAEINAIDNAGGSVEGATLYVTLEPCTHLGKTPPCAPVICDNGIRNVVIGMKDPNPVVHGSGIEYLREKGIRVTAGVLEKEILKLNESYVKFIGKGMPFCNLKTAMTLDGKIATITNASRWISGERSRRYVHELRQQSTALLVGIDTVIYDDPLLNTRRGRMKSKDPLKIIADSRCRIPLEAKVMAYNPQLTIIATTEMADKSKIRDIERLGAQILICPLKNNKVDLEYMVSSLGMMGIDSILIEGGSTLAFHAIKAGIVDKVTSFISPKILGGKTAPTPIGGDGIDNMEDALKISDWRFRRMGEDILVEGYIRQL